MMEGTVRILIAVAVSMLIGYFYYDPEVSPLGKKWVEIVKPKQHADLTPPLAGTVLAKTLLALFINGYVYNRAYSLWGLARMSFDLTFMSMLLSLTHYLWATTDLRVLGINVLYDFLIVFAISLIVGYRRTINIDHRKIVINKYA